MQHGVLLGSVLVVLSASGPSHAEPNENHVEVSALHGVNVGTSGRVLDGAERCTVSASSAGVAAQLGLGGFEPDSTRSGYIVTLDAALRRDSLIVAEGSCDTYEERATIAGSSMRFGYGWRRFGIELGAGAVSGGEELSGFVPLLRFVVRSEAVAVAWGIGSNRPAHALGPGLFVNLSTNRHEPFSFELETGLYLGGPAMEQSFTFEIELVLGVRILPSLELRPGFGFASPSTLGVPGYQSSLGVRWDLERRDR